MRKNIAIVWGGYSSEKEVSEKSAAGIYSFIDKELYNTYKVRIDIDGWYADVDGALLEIAKKVGATCKVYDNEKIYKMRLIMAIKKQA